jgi:hypothetical protein
VSEADAHERMRGDQHPAGWVCRDCGESDVLLWLRPEVVRRLALDLIDNLDREVPKGFMPMNSLRLTPGRWQWESLSVEEWKAAEQLRLRYLHVNWRTCWFRELVYLLVRYAKQWLCHGAVDGVGRCVPSAFCRALDPEILTREWERLFNDRGEGHYSLVTPAQMRDVFKYLDEVSLQRGPWLFSRTCAASDQAESWSAFLHTLAQEDG